MANARKATLEVSQKDVRREGVLRITADKSTAEYAAQDIEEALQNIETRHIQLKPWKSSLAHGVISKDKDLSSLYAHKDLEMVATTVGTSVEVADDHTVRRSPTNQGLVILTCTVNNQGFG